MVRAAHTINEAGSTQLARLGPCRPDQPAAGTLPALPTPALSVVGGDSLLVRWSQVKLAAGYCVEVRPCDDEDGPWTSVNVSSECLKGNRPYGTLPEGLLGPQCAGCKVNNVTRGVDYEARVTYFAACGYKSHVSASSAPCHVPAAHPDDLASPGSSPASRLGEDTPLRAGFAASPPPQEAPSLPVALSFPAPAACPSSPPLQPPPALVPDVSSLTSGLELATGAPELTSPPPSQPPSGVPQHGMMQQPPDPGWRSSSGYLIPAPCAPELIPLEEEAGRGLLIQWPVVIHAAAYTVELFDESTAAVERFHRTVSENQAEALVELRVVNLQPGSYGACVRCIAPDGCESAPSPWSFLPPAWLQSPATLGWHMPPQAVGATQQPPTYLQSAPSAAGGATLLSTSPGTAPPAAPSLVSSSTHHSPPPPPAEPPAVQAAAPPPSAPPGAALSGAATSPPAAPIQAAVKPTALVLD